MSRAFEVIDVEQRSQEWFAARLGKATGSQAKNVLAAIKSGEAAGRRNYRLQLALERITGRLPEEGFTSKAMQRGVDCEPMAMAAYESLTGQIAMPVGFVVVTGKMIGCSPDGVIGDFEGLLSLKCPESSTHLGYIVGGVMPSDYVPQMLHELRCCPDAKFYDFVSWDDRMPEGLDTFHVRVQRDDVAVDAYAAKLDKFLEEVDAEVALINRLMAQRKAA